MSYVHPNKVRQVHDYFETISQGRILVVTGPPGCGKTQTLVNTFKSFSFRSKIFSDCVFKSKAVFYEFFKDVHFYSILFFRHLPYFCDSFDCFLAGLENCWDTRKIIVLEKSSTESDNSLYFAKSVLRSRVDSISFNKVAETYLRRYLRSKEMVVNKKLLDISHGSLNQALYYHKFVSWKKILQMRKIKTTLFFKRFISLGWKSLVQK